MLYRLLNRSSRALLALTALLATALAVLAPAALAPAAFALSGAPATAPAAQQQTFGIQPATASAPDQRPSFTYLATPGAQLKDHVAVYNYGDDPLTLTLYAADAFNTASGGYDVLPAGKPSTDVGSWVHLAAGSLVLPPRTREIVPFTLAIPATAGPGDHSGGIVLALRRQTVDAKGNAVTVDQRVGTRIHLRVPGALRPGLSVESVSVHYRGTLNPFGTGATTVSYTVRNTGNIRLAGHQAVRVRNVLGMVATAKGPSDLTELLPGNTATYSVQVPGVFPTLWSTASITVDPQAVPGDTDPALASSVSNNIYATIPWTLIALLIPVIWLLVAALLRWRRRRRNGGFPSPFGPTGPGGTPAMPTAPTAPSAPEAPTSGPQAPTGSGPVSPVPVPVAVPVPGATPAPEVPSPREPAPTGATDPAAVPSTPPVPTPTPASATDPAGLPTLPVPSAAPLADAASPAGPVVTPAEAGAAPVPPLASAEVPPASPAPSAEPAATASRRVVPVRPLLRGLGASTLVVAALFGGSVAALAADASGSAAPTPAGSGSASGGPGVLWFDYAKGHDDDPVNVATSGLCPSQDDWVSAAITGPGFPASGASALGLSAAKIYSPSSTGGFVVPLDQTLRAIARQNGVPQLHGAYRVDVFCRGRFNPAHLRDFYGTLTFGAGEAWAADRATAIALPQSMEPPASAMPKPKPQPVAAPAASTGDGISPVSIVTMAAGAVLLLALGGQALRRRRAEVVAAKTDAKNETKPQTEKTKAAQR